ncbi:MAG: NADH-quinone oxidoreductase subunit N [Gemmatimonadetes bacterium]|nr:NADH-quinone oxidoreductase subunit N [Gemmatimonadota bacterium]
MHAMAFDLSIPSHLFHAYLPDLILMGGGMLLLLWAVWRPESDAHARSTGWAAIGVAVLALVAVIWEWQVGFTAMNGPIAVDPFRWATDAVVLVGTMMTLAIAMDFNGRMKMPTAEAHVLVLLSASGMMLVAAARDLMVLFLGIELMSVSVYVLSGIDRRSARGAEASLKYFLLGAFSSAFLLYGIAMVYGATGSTNLVTIGEQFATPAVATQPIMVIGLALLLVGFAFKIAAAPFHMWTPDVYDGAPAPYSGFMACAVKAASFAALVRVCLEAVGPGSERWHLALWWLAALTMVVGNLFALQQRNVKRMISYSSIAHAGFLLVAVTAQTTEGAAAIIFYLVAYTLATLGAFAVVVALNEGKDGATDIGDYSGLWTVRPGLAMAMAVFMLALLGFPLVGGMGFFAKWYVLQAALKAPAPQTKLSIVLVLATVVSAGFYLYVVMVMFMRPRPEGASVPPGASGTLKFVIAASVAGILFFGLYPSPAVKLAQQAAAASFVPAASRVVAAPAANASP